MRVVVKAENQNSNTKEDCYSAFGVSYFLKPPSLSPDSYESGLFFWSKLKLSYTSASEVVVKPLEFVPFYTTNSKGFTV